MRPSRIPFAVVVVAVLAACDGGASEPGTASPSASPAVDARGEAIAALNADVEAVAAAQRRADAVLRSTIDAVASLDAGIAALRDPELVDEAVEQWPAARGALQRIDVDSARTIMREVAGAVDEARSDLALARSMLEDPWELRYLAAQDEVLQAVRAHAAAGDALAQVIGQHRGTYERAVEIADTFVEQRWFYRSPEEATDAFDVELAGTIQALREARQQVATFVDRRDEAATSVNDASEEAASVWADRPSEQPTATAP